MPGTDARAQVIVGDGIAYAAQATSGSFDVIIVDSTDPAGPGEVLFTEAFYRELRPNTPAWRNNGEPVWRAIYASLRN